MTVFFIEYIFYLWFYLILYIYYLLFPIKDKIIEEKTIKKYDDL